MRKVKKDGLNITITSNTPSQAACDAFREKLHSIYRGYIVIRDKECYNGADDIGKEDVLCSLCKTTVSSL